MYTLHLDSRICTLNNIERLFIFNLVQHLLCKDRLITINEKKYSDYRTIKFFVQILTRVYSNDELPNGF